MAEGVFASPDDRRSYILQGAKQRGIDPSLIDRLVRSEGGYSGYDRTGDHGQSFGPFQDYIGGGLGNTMLGQGLDPTNPRNELAVINWNLDYIQKHGASPDTWHGLRRGQQAEGYYGGAQHINVQKDIPPEADNSLLLYAGILDALGGESGKDESKPAFGTLQADTSGQPTPGATERTKPEQGDELLNAIKDRLDQTHPPNQLSGQPLPGIPGLPGVQQPATQMAGMPVPPAAPQGMEVPDIIAPAPRSQDYPQDDEYGRIPKEGPALTPVRPPQDTQTAGLYNGVLNALKQFNPIGAAQAGELPAKPPTPAPASPTAPQTQQGNPVDSILRGMSTNPMMGPGIELLREYLQGPQTVKTPGENQTSLPIDDMLKSLTTSPFLPPGMLATALGPLLGGEQAKPTDALQAYIADPMARSDVDIQRRAAQGPPSAGASAQDLAQMVAPYLAGGAPGGSMSAGARIPRGAGRVRSATQGASMKGPGPILDPPTVGEGIDVTATRIDDGLYRLQKSATADRIDMRQMIEALPDELRDPEFQRQVYEEVEDRMVDPDVPYSSSVDAFFDRPEIGALADEQTLLYNRLRRKLDPGAQNLIDVPGINETGYVHRKVVGQGEYFGRLDPERARTTDVVTGGGNRSLSKKASSLEGRQYYILEKSDGTRAGFGRLEDSGFEFGETRKGNDGSTYTVKPATSAEVEASTGTRYYHNWLANTADNVLRLRRVERNVDLLASLKPDLESRGLWVKEGGKPPEGYERVDIPQLRGYASPKIAQTLNDFYGANPNDLDGFLRKVNRLLVGSLFITPIPHAGNVGAHWMVGRGWDWIKPQSYADLTASGIRAARAVWQQNHDYTQMLREGSGLLYGDVANQNFYKVMMEKLFNEMVVDERTWGPFARAIGFPTVHKLVAAMYGWSSRTLWLINDVFMLQRQFELMRKGMPAREAIYQAERDIPNYRIPSQVMGNRPLALALKNPNYMNFGRYRYGQVRAYASIINDLIGKSATPAQRLEAAGKLAVLVIGASALYPVADWALQKATGNDKARVQRFGPYSIADAALNAAGVDLDNMVLGLDPEQRGWLQNMASVVTPAPTIGIGMEAITGKDIFGRDVISPQSSLLGKGVQAGEAAAGAFYPTQMALQAARQGPASAAGRLVGLRLPNPEQERAKRKAERFQRSQARGRERRDPIERWLKDTIGQVLQ